MREGGNGVKRMGEGTEVGVRVGVCEKQDEKKVRRTNGENLKSKLRTVLDTRWMLVTTHYSRIGGGCDSACLYN